MRGRRAIGLIGIAGLLVTGAVTGCGGSDPSPAAGPASSTSATSGGTTSGGTTAASASDTPSTTPTPTPRRTTAPARHIVNRGELKLGMCVTEPTGELVENSLFEAVPCTKPHPYEFGASFELPKRGSGTDAAIEKAAFAACDRSTLPAQVAKLNRKGRIYTYTAFFPTKDSWAHGNRGVDCFLSLVKERNLPNRSLLKP